jgi:hypothetical protein
MTAFAVGTQGTLGTAETSFEVMTATGSGVNTRAGSGVTSFKKMVAAGYASGTTSIAFSAMTATGQAANAGIGSSTFLPMQARNYGAFAYFETMVMAGAGGTVRGSVFSQTFN